jgi:hypothetical protein
MIWRLRFLDAPQVIGFQHKYVLIDGVDDGLPLALCLTHKSLLPLNPCCKEEHEELLRLFKLEAEANKDLNPVEWFWGKRVNSYEIDVCRDIAEFNSAWKVITFGNQSLSCKGGELNLAKLQHIAIKEVASKMPYITKAGTISRGSWHELWGFREFLQHLYLFPALKSITIIRLCYRKKVPKIPGQKRHRSPYIVMDKEDADIMVEFMQYLINRRQNNKPSIKVLNFPA